MNTDEKKKTKRQRLMEKVNGGKTEKVPQYLPPMIRDDTVIPSKKKRASPIVPVGQKFVPSIDQREGVAQLRSCGWEVNDIAAAMRIPSATLERHFKAEIKDGANFVKGMITRSITRGALAGDKALMIFYAKSQMGWHDTRPWGMSTDKNGNPVGAPPALFTVNIMGLGAQSPQVSVSTPPPTIEGEPVK